MLRVNSCVQNGVYSRASARDADCVHGLLTRSGTGGVPRRVSELASYDAPNGGWRHSTSPLAAGAISSTLGSPITDQWWSRPGDRSSAAGDRLPSHGGAYKATGRRASHSDCHPGRGASVSVATVLPHVREGRKKSEPTRRAHLPSSIRRPCTPPRLPLLPLCFG